MKKIVDSNEPEKPKDIYDKHTVEGTKILGDSEKPNVQPVKKSNNILLIIVVVLIIVTICVMVYFNMKKAKETTSTND